MQFVKVLLVDLCCRLGADAAKGQKVSFEWEASMLKTSTYLKQNMDRLHFLFKMAAIAFTFTAIALSATIPPTATTTFFAAKPLLALFFSALGFTSALLMHNAGNKARAYEQVESIFNNYLSLSSEIQKNKTGYAEKIQNHIQTITLLQEQKFLFLFKINPFNAPFDIETFSTTSYDRYCSTIYRNSLCQNLWSSFESFKHEFQNPKASDEQKAETLEQLLMDMGKVVYALSHRGEGSLFTESSNRINILGPHLKQFILGQLRGNVDRTSLEELKKQYLQKKEFYVGYYFGFTTTILEKAKTIL